MKTFNSFLLGILIVLVITTFVIRIFQFPIFPTNISDGLTIIFLLISYFIIFYLGLDAFQDIIGEKEINKKKFWKFGLSQILIFIGLTVIFSLSGINVTLEYMRYFEMGSYSLIITTFIFGYLDREKNEDQKKICLLTLTSAFVFFIFGIILFLNDITKILGSIIPISSIENSGFFLGSYNLLFSVILLYEYFTKNFIKEN